MTISIKSFSKISLALGALSLAFVGSAAAYPGHSSKSAAARPAAVALAGAPMKAKKQPRKAKQVADHSARKAAKLARFDLDKSGTLEPNERLAMKKLRFAKLDANSDGSISIEEMRAAKKARKAKKAKRAKRGKALGHAKNPAAGRANRGKAMRGKPGKRGMRGKGQGQMRRFAALDTDRSGGLSWGEFSAPRTKPGKALKRRDHRK